MRAHTSYFPGFARVKSYSSDAPDWGTFFSTSAGERLANSHFSPERYCLLPQPAEAKATVERAGDSPSSQTTPARDQVTSSSHDARVRHSREVFMTVSSREAGVRATLPRRAGASTGRH